MRCQTCAVEFEVQPIVRERLDEAKDGFAEDGINAWLRRLVQDGDNGVAKDEGDESVGALDAVLDQSRKFPGVFLGAITQFAQHALETKLRPLTKEPQP